ncbi:acyl carrier protein [Sclerotinia borealis F-4128]|uniref:Acyl carrier protein n=1 Tax=Sclerotinia borealis (strain F-4128) TaxID=1432307 RepID=W9CLB6_SCLBF|nr:acyl carrier protein [Sclerotinia borealis F-4128]
MFRTALLRSARSAVSKAVQRPAAIARPIAPSSFVTKSQFAPSAFQAARCYSAAAGLNKGEVEGRILSLLSNFDKVADPTKLSASAHFSNDLGLDSLDTVEVVMAIEEEFSIEIPDKEADAILSVDQAVEYILHQPDAH